MNRSLDPETAALRDATGALLMGDPRYMAGLAAYPCAFMNAIHRELLEAVVIPLRETNRLEEVCEHLDRAGKPALAELLVRLARDDVYEAERRKPWRSIEHLQPQLRTRSRAFSPRRRCAS